VCMCMRLRLSCHYPSHNLNFFLQTAISADNRMGIKEKIRASVVNNGGSTNLEAAVLEGLATPNASVIFVTDGLANMGTLQTSAALIKLARAHPNYKTCTVNTLGLQSSQRVDAHGNHVRVKSPLNAVLLKALAMDTNGAFRLAADTESIAAFVGDAMGGHIFRVYDRVDLRAKSSSGHSGKVLEVPHAGFVVRTDRPTQAVVQWPKEAMGTLHVTAEAMPANSALGLTTTSIAAEGIASPSQAAIVVKFLAGLAYEKGIISPELIAATEEMAASFPELLPLAISLREPRAPPKDIEDIEEVDRVQRAYNYTSLGAADTTPGVEDLRQTVRILSQQQGGGGGGGGGGGNGDGDGSALAP
jgi:hypothetical protein